MQGVRVSQSRHVCVRVYNLPHNIHTIPYCTFYNYTADILIQIFEININYNIVLKDLRSLCFLN